jgi:hypothetical protein
MELTQLVAREEFITVGRRNINLQLRHLNALVSYDRNSVDI